MIQGAWQNKAITLNKCPLFTFVCHKKKLLILHIHRKKVNAVSPVETLSFPLSSIGYAMCVYEFIFKHIFDGK